VLPPLPPAVVDTDDDRDVVEPSGGNVMLEVASSPPHAAPISAETTTVRASGLQRCRRGPAAASILSTSSRYRLAASGWWSSHTRAQSAAVGDPDAFAVLALRSESRAGHGRDKRDVPW
jgi:hypothetical protein